MDGHPRRSNRVTISTYQTKPRNPPCPGASGAWLQVWAKGKGVRLLDALMRLSSVRKRSSKSVLSRGTKSVLRYFRSAACAARPALGRFLAKFRPPFSAGRLFFHESSAMARFKSRYDRPAWNATQNSYSIGYQNMKSLYSVKRNSLAVGFILADFQAATERPFLRSHRLSERPKRARQRLWTRAVSNPVEVQTLQPV
jgi:hypothetical protein